MGFRERLVNSLEGLADPEDVQLEEAQPSGRVGGVVVSGVFEGLSQTDRQKLLWERLDERLSAADLRRIVAILTLTPEEFEAAV